MLIKSIPIFLLICGILAFSSCTSSIFRSYTDTHSIFMVKIECTDRISDSDIVSYSKQPMRSKEHIYKTFKEYEKDLSEAFDRKDSLFNKLDSFQIELNISSSGRLTFITMNDGINNDSSRMPQIDEKLNKIQIDSIYSSIYSSKPGNYTFILKSKIDSSRMSQINDKLNKIKIDSIDNDIISSTAYISLRYAENYGYNIKSIDSIIYGQIRSKGSIMRTVMSNLKYLRYAYNWRLRQKPGLKGKISIKFAINSQGKIIYCKNIQSTMNDPLLEKDVEKIVSKWEFCPINSRIDVTEVVYPFVFSQ